MGPLDLVLRTGSPLGGFAAKPKRPTSRPTAGDAALASEGPGISREAFWASPAAPLRPSGCNSRRAACRRQDSRRASSTKSLRAGAWDARQRPDRGDTAPDCEPPDRPHKAAPGVSFYRATLLRNRRTICGDYRLIRRKVFGSPSRNSAHNSGTVRCPYGIASATAVPRLRGRWPLLPALFFCDVLPCQCGQCSGAGQAS